MYSIKITENKTLLLKIKLAQSQKENKKGSSNFGPECAIHINSPQFFIKKKKNLLAVPNVLVRTRNLEV